MSKYKISDLEKLSGIKAHTIRVWEQRYNLLVPLRTDTNIRYYDDLQLRKLLNAVTLANSGVKISAIASLSDQQINEKLISINTTAAPELKEEILINQLISSGLGYDEELFNSAFNSAITTFGIITAYSRIFYPMLVKIGVLWNTADVNPAQEHFISSLFKQKIFAGINNLEPNTNSNEKWLLFLPQHEDHELGLLISNYILRNNKKHVFYLGANVPLENLKEAIENISPTHILLFLVKNHPTTVLQDMMNELKSMFPKATYICCKPELSDEIKTGNKQKMIFAFDDFLKVAK